MDTTWIDCPHCGLKHRPRAQSLCPRCGRTSTGASGSTTASPGLALVRSAPVSAPVPSPPVRALEPAPTVEHIPASEVAPPQAGPSSPQKNPAIPLAGGILLVNAVLHLFEFLFLPSVSTDASLRSAQLAGTLVGVGIDALLGVSFLLGRTGLRTFAFVRLVVGMFLFGGMSLYQAQYLFTLVVCAFSCGVLVMAWGKPSSFLAGVGLTAVLVSVAVELIGFTRLAATQPLSDRARIALRPDLEGRLLHKDDAIVGDRHTYKLRIPSDGWYRRKAEVARSTDSNIDAWLTHPDLGGNLTVSMRSWNEVEAEDLREARKLALRDLQAQYPDFQEAEASDDDTRLEAPDVAILSGHATRNGKPFLFEVSLFKRDDLLLRVTAFAPTESFAPLHLGGATTQFQPD